jgi:hypothetical protein
LNEVLAYFDESGVHDSSDMVCVAGFISTSSYWKAFDIEWRQSLKEWNLEWYHHKELLDGQGSYGQLSCVKRDALFAQLCSIINKHVQGGVVVRISRSQYDSVFSKDTKLVCGGIYGLAAYHCLMWFGSLVEKEFPDVKTRFVYADGAPHAKQIKKAFATITSNYEAKKGRGGIAIEFAQARLYPPLQAADILATEHYLQRKLVPPTILIAGEFGLRQLLKKPLKVNDVDLEALTYLNTQFSKVLNVKRKYDAEQRWLRKKKLLEPNNEL